MNNVILLIIGYHSNTIIKGLTMQDDKVILNTVRYGRKEGKRLFRDIIKDYPVLDENDYRGYGIAFELFEMSIVELYTSKVCSERYLLETLLKVCARTDELVARINALDEDEE